jgi:hypothetical protein
MDFDVRRTLRFRPSELHVPSVYTKRIGINQNFFYGLTFELSRQHWVLVKTWRLLTDKGQHNGPGDNHPAEP